MHSIREGGRIRDIPMPSEETTTRPIWRLAKAVGSLSPLEIKSMTDTPTLGQIAITNMKKLAAVCSVPPLPEEPGRSLVTRIIRQSARDAAHGARILAEMAKALEDLDRLRDPAARQAFYIDAATDARKAMLHLKGAAAGVRGGAVFIEARAQDRSPPALANWPDDCAMDLARTLLPDATGDALEEAAYLISLKVDSFR
jgi:hypothetical protein